MMTFLVKHVTVKMNTLDSAAKVNVFFMLHVMYINENKTVAGLSTNVSP